MTTPTHLHPDQVRHAGYYPCGTCPEYDSAGRLITPATGDSPGALAQRAYEAVIAGRPDARDLTDQAARAYAGQNGS